MATTNKEKYGAKILELIPDHDIIFSLAVNKETGEPMSCRNGCDKCKFQGKERCDNEMKKWLYKQAD